MTKKTKRKDDKTQKQKSRQTKQICTSLHPPASFSSYQLYRMKKVWFLFLKKEKRQKTEKKAKQNDIKGKKTKNTIVKMSKAEKKTRQTKQIYTAHSSPPCLIFVLSFFLSLTAFIYGMWKQFEFDNIIDQRSISNRKSSFFWIHVQSLSLAISHLVF